MDFLKKYWWVFALILGAVLVYWFMFRKNETTNKSPLACDSHEAMIKAKEAEVRANQSWFDAAKDQTKVLGHPCYGMTVDQCVRINAMDAIKAKLPADCITWDYTP